MRLPVIASRFFREVILPAGLLASLIIGAGMFAMPYVFEQAGFWVGFAYLVLFAGLVTLVHHMYAVVVTETEGKHRFVGYARIYLGRFGFWTSTVTTGLGILLILTAYIILASSFLEVVFSEPLGFYPYAFWAAGSMAVILSLRRLVRLEFLVVVFMGVIVGTLFGVGLTSGGGVGLGEYNPAFLFLPYGVVLFSLGGRAGISTLADYYVRNGIEKKRMHAAIITGSVFPAVLYVFFVLAVFSLSPEGVSEDALSGLSGISGTILTLVGILGLLALWTSYVLMGLEVRDIMRYDLKLPLLFALAVVIGVPLLLFTFGFGGLIEILGLAGGVFLALESMMVVLMYFKIRGWNFAGSLLCLVFAVGAFYEIYQFIL